MPRGGSEGRPDSPSAAPSHRVANGPPAGQVLNAFQFVDFSEGDLIFREGDPGVSFILIREGHVKLFKDGGDGASEECGEKGAGEHLGEKSLLHGSPREFDAVVTSKTCQCAFLDQAKFVECMGPIADVLQRANEVVRMDDLDEHRLLGVGTFGKVRGTRVTRRHNCRAGPYEGAAECHRPCLCEWRPLANRPLAASPANPSVPPLWPTCLTRLSGPPVWPPP